MASSSAAPAGLPKKKKEKEFKPSGDDNDIEDTLEEEEKLPPADTKVSRSATRASPMLRHVPADQQCVRVAAICRGS